MSANSFTKEIGAENEPVLNQENQWKLWVPTELTNSLIEDYHNPPLACHGGIAKTLERLRRYFYWPRMAVQVRDYVAKCDICKQTKAPNQTLRPAMGAQSMSDRPFQKLYVDILGPYPRSLTGHVGILIVLDHFSKFHWLKPLKKLNSIPIIKFLEEDIFHTFGVPETLVSDNGVQFKSAGFKQLLKNYNVEHIFTPVYSPQSNASERVNRSIISGIRAYITEDQRTWDKNVSKISSALRSSLHSSTGYSPYYLLFGLNMISDASTYSLLRNLNSVDDQSPFIERKDQLQIMRQTVRENIRKAYERNTKTYNTRSKTVEFVAGQEIYRRNFSLSKASNHYNAKLAQKFLKCRIVRKIGTACYEIEDLQGKRIGIYHAKDLRR